MRPACKTPFVSEAARTVVTEAERIERLVAVFEGAG
jgi:hypothetical protein